MNHAARPLAFSYVRSQGPRGITIRTGRESPAQDSPAGSHPPQAKPNVRIMPRWVRVRVRVRMAERHSGDLFVGVQPQAFRRVSQRWGYRPSFQPAMRPPPVSAHIRKPKERGSPAKWT